jgi:RES domain-containing protein
VRAGRAPAHIFLWRLSKDTASYSASDLTGRGAAKAGGRWNEKGSPAVYCSSSVSLSALEVLVHTGSTEIHIRNLFLVEISIPNRLLKSASALEVSTLPKAWLASPPSRASTSIGQAWLDSGTAVALRVPSIVVPEEFNFVLNPRHPDMKHIAARVVRQFVFDPRLK